MTSADIHQLVARHLKAEADHDAARAAAYYAADGYYDSVPLGLRFAGRDAVALQYDASYRAMPDGAVTIEGEVAGDRRLVHWGTLHASMTGPFLGLPPTGNAVALLFVARYEFRGEQILGETLYFDLATFCEQAGHALADVKAAARGLREALGVRS